jgi:divalent metal cation (Fe/Co/Zn/Cd) transporter
MSENTLKHELLKQNGKTAVDEEVGRLHAIIEAEGRRVRRLTWWTIGVWAIWFLMIASALVMPMIAYQAARGSAQETTHPATQPAVVHHPPGTAAAVFAGIIGVILFAAFFGLPVAGIVLALMLIFTRRSASMNQVRASLAAIDAQLRVLGASGLPNPSEPK